MSLSQWERLLKNAGTWQGSFTQLSPAGQEVKDTPTEVALKPLSGGQLMRQEIRKMPVGEPPTEQVLEYRTLGRSILLFENGAFSNGSIQWGPFSEFGAELGLIQQDRRLRLAQVFDRSSQLQSVTLIRERLEGSNTPENPSLQLSDVLGTWEGEAVTVYPDFQPETTQNTKLTVEQVTDHQIRQTVAWDESTPPISSTGQVAGNVIKFETGTQPVQVLLLPDGASSTCPTQIKAGKPFFLEVGWLIDPHLRQRMIRSYSAQGAWVSLTLITEVKT